MRAASRCGEAFALLGGRECSAVCERQATRGRLARRAAPFRGLGSNARKGCSAVCARSARTKKRNPRCRYPFSLNQQRALVLCRPAPIKRFRIIRDPHSGFASCLTSCHASRHNAVSVEAPCDLILRFRAFGNHRLRASRCGHGFGRRPPQALTSSGCAQTPEPGRIFTATGVPRTILLDL